MDFKISAIIWEDLLRDLSRYSGVLDIISPLYPGCNFPSVIQTTPWFDHYDLPARNKWVVQYSNAKMTVSFNFEEGGEIQENAGT